MARSFTDGIGSMQYEDPAPAPVFGVTSVSQGAQLHLKLTGKTEINEANLQKCRIMLRDCGLVISRWSMASNRTKSMSVCC